MLDEKRRIREIRIAEEEYFWHKGLEEGMEKGLERGLEQGMARGIEQSRFEIANNMLNDGTPLDLVSKFTGLSLSQLQQLQTGHLS